MSTMQFEVTEDDVFLVLSKNPMCVANSRGASFESMASMIFNDIDIDEVEKVAVQFDSIDDQVIGAHKEIERQLRAQGVLEPLRAASMRPS